MNSVQLTQIQSIIFYIFFFIAAAIVGFPRICLRNHPKVTSEEIAILDPKLRGVKYLYPIPLIICPTIILVLLVAAGSPLGKPAFNEMFLFFPVILFIGFYDGLFALITGIFPAMIRWNFNRFVYDPLKAYRWIAQLQILLAILGIMICLAMFLNYPG